MSRATPEPTRFAVRLDRVPDPEGPYDEPATRGALALAPSLAPSPTPRRAEPPPAEGGEPALRLVPPLGDEEDDGDFFGPERTVRGSLPPPAPFAARLTQALLEVLAGDRPVGQLNRYATPEVCADVEDLVQPGGPRPWAATLKRLVVSEPADGVAEVAAVVSRGARATALALRLEGLDGRWQITALEVG